MKTKKIVLIYVLLIATICTISSTIFAQQIKEVDGKVINSTDKKPLVGIKVYAFNTVAEARDMQKKLEENKETLIETISTETDQEGYYSIKVSEDGALLFKADMVKEAHLEKIKGRLRIDVSMKGGNILDEVIAKGSTGIIVIKKGISRDSGNYRTFQGSIILPPHYGKTYGRLIVQPYIIDCITGDTLTHLEPLIYDGKQYHITQERRMDFHLEHDTLYPFIKNIPLTSKKMKIDVCEKVFLRDLERNYKMYVTFQFENYQDIYFRKENLLSDCRAIRPLKFLEYSFEQYHLDPHKYRLRAQREKRNTADNISLTFLVGKAQLDPQNPQNDTLINKLKNDLLDVLHGEGTTLKEFHITGIASPEGSYASNLSLAQKRVRFAQEQITSVLPRQVLERVYQNPQAEVASWLQVAELLETDSLTEKGKEIRKIVEQYPQNPDVQYAHIARLPYYTSTIKKYLPRLRTVRYEYKYEIFRELTPNEIYHKYLYDKDYISGKKNFALYEYWHLFNMEKDPRKLEKLYKDAYRISRQTNADSMPWILAANNLAISYLKRDTADLSILAPFIQERRLWTDKINVGEIVANQILMYLKKQNFSKASTLLFLLRKNSKYEKLAAFSLCLAGKYNMPPVFELVKKTSPLNEIIMYLAKEEQQATKQAANLIEKQKALEPHNPLLWYLEAVVHMRTSIMPGSDEYIEESEAENCLLECFKLNKKYISIAEGDGEFKEYFFKNVMNIFLKTFKSSAE